MNTLSHLIQTCKALLENKAYDEILEILSTSVLQQHEHHELYSIRGYAYYSLDQCEEGIADCRHALMLNAENSRAWRISGVHALKDKEYEKCRECCTNAIQFDPEDIFARLTRAQANMLDGEYAAAKPDYAALLGEESISDQVWLGMGHVLCFSEDFEEALLYYKKLFGHEDLFGTAGYHAGLCYSKLGRYAEALEAYDIAYPHSSQFEYFHFERGIISYYLRHYIDALKDMKLQLTATPEHADSVMFRGACYYYLNEFTAAINDFNDTLELAPGYPNVYYMNAASHDKCGMSQEALALFLEYLNYYPDHQDTLYNIGNIYFVLSHFVLAKEYYDRLITTDPGYYAAYPQRCATHRELQLFDLAIADGGQAVVMQPRNPIGYHELGNAYLSHNDYERAATTLQKAMELYLNSNQVISPELYFNLGNSAYHTRQYLQAIQYLDQAFEKFPRLAAWYDMRSRALYKLNREQEALTNINAAIELEPDSYCWYLNRAVMYQRLDLYDKALEDANHALFLAPDQPWIYLVRSPIYRSLGYQEKSLLDVQSLHRLAPELPTYWLLLSVHEEEVLNEHLGYNTLNCLYRFMIIDSPDYFRMDQGMTYSVYGTNALLISTLNHELPMILVEILEQRGYGQPEDNIIAMRKAFDITANFRKQFNHWKIRREYPEVSLLAEAVMQFYLNNPPATYKILKQQPALNCMGYVYLYQAAKCCLEPDADDYIQAALPLARQTLANPESSQSERYYAATLLDLAGKVPQAIQELKKLKDENFSAATYKWAGVCARPYADNEDALKLFLKQMDNLHGQFMAYYQDIKPVGISGEEHLVLKELSSLLYAMENSEIIALLLKTQGGDNYQHTTFDEEFFFARRVRFHQFEDYYERHITKHKDTPEYQLVFGKTYEKEDLEYDLMDYTRRGSDGYMHLGKAIHQHSFTAYTYKKQDYKQQMQFEIRKYMILVSNLFEAGVYSSEEAHLLHQYIYYCIRCYAETAVDESVTVILNESKGLIDTAQLLGLGLGYGTFESVLKYFYYKLNGKDSPVLDFQTFLDKFCRKPETGVEEVWN
ncbi:tetratricopeptide repeat protein [Chitinophaga sp. sic0106]|uniref:tetratricopeptide repeat protein n=1 Tax=Chitinophaga sp. sic0106 TaxID=2854785 RepID=UPI001C481F3A|nr:tetratricopeptide repeat protein [Chitinophaga sp. sic0106]MBV7530776.1 tetratricopeptide repeat protein [Chitinophaga sp. sic0106]